MFKIGDTVKVKEDLITGKKYNGCLFAYKMKKYRGEFFTVIKKWENEVSRSQRYKLSHKNGTKEIVEWIFSDDMLELHEEKNKQNKKEEVNHPEHYNKGIEAIDIIESWGLNFSLGNAIKYITRAPYKGTELKDLKKAEWYIQREIKRLENLEKEAKNVL